MCAIYEIKWCPMTEDKEFAPPSKQYEQFISSLPISRGTGAALRHYNGHWYPENLLPGALAFSDGFAVRDTDIILASVPKCGTTWLMALAFAIVNRKDYHPSAPNHPNIINRTHDVVKIVETEMAISSNYLEPDFFGTSPRVIATHLPLQYLRKSLSSSKCRVVYVCREPKDTMISSWHFINGLLEVKGNLTLEQALEAFCDGKSPYGPMWDHYLDYWRESLERPDRVLFLKYEEMKEDPLGNVRRLAEFVGSPFSEEENSEGMAEKIVELCSFKKLSSNEENRDGTRRVKGFVLKNSSYFRKGQVGDWKNYLTDEMANKIDAITEEKLRGSGLTFGCLKPVSN